MRGKRAQSEVAMGKRGPPRNGEREIEGEEEAEIET